MKKTIFLSVVIALCFISLTPESAQASKETGASAFRVSDTQVLFLLKFDFGFLNRAAALSYLTNLESVSTPTLTYSVTGDKTNDTLLESVGILLGENTTVENRFHLIPYGETENFTLLAIATIPKSQDSTYTLTVTGLPYRTIDQAGVTYEASYPQNQMNNFKVTFAE